MVKIGFDNEKYLALQAEHIRQRMSQFGGKLYLEFGGKLFDDYHASRVLPGLLLLTWLPPVLPREVGVSLT